LLVKTTNEGISKIDNQNVETSPSNERDDFTSSKKGQVSTVGLNPFDNRENTDKNNKREES
jgi:hypothetical protein